MDGREDPQTVLVAWLIDACADVDIIRWANRHEPSSLYANDRDYLALSRSNPRNPRDIATASERVTPLVERCFPSFDVTSEEAEARARSALLARIANYLSGNLSPYDVCRMRVPIESLYFGDRGYPAWLGGFAHGCDWVELDTAPGQVPSLRDEIEEILSDNRALGRELKNANLA